MEFKEKATGLLQSVSSFYQENKNRVLYIGGGILAIAAGIIAWNYYYIPQQEEAASEKFAKISHFFTTDSMDIVLKGDKKRKITSAVEIADDYSFTKKGKEAALMAGLAYLNKGQTEKALEYLNKFEAEDSYLYPSVIAAKATCYSDQGDYKKAAGLYEKAAKEANSEASASFYVRAAQHYEKAEDLKSALECYEVVVKKYSTAEDGKYFQNAEINIYRLKGLMGDLN